MKKENKLALKSLDIRDFKTFTEPVHIDFAEGLNIFLITTKYSLPSGLWDFCDALNWLFGFRMDHGNNIIFYKGVDFAEVGATVIDEDGNEITITRRVSKGGKEPLSESEQNALTHLKESFVREDINTLTFGNTKIVTTGDKELAMRADKMIGITTDETGKKSKVLVLSREKN